MLLNITADAPCRAWIANMSQFNGKFGCTWCEIETTTTATDRTTRYPRIEKDKLKLRDVEEVWRNGLLAVQSETPVKGVKGNSILTEIPNFDMINGMIPEYMHCVVEGVFKMLLEAFLARDEKAAYSIGSKIKQLKARFNQIKLTSSAARVPRSLDLLHFWKATEIEIFSFLFAPIVFKGILPEPYYKNFLILCSAIYKLSKNSCFSWEIRMAEKEIECFLDGLYTLYPRKFWRYNTHIMQHLGSAVRSFGPLPVHSAYLYENDLGHLKNLVSRYRHVPQQLFNKLCVKEYIPIYMREKNCDSFMRECDRKLFSELSKINEKKFVEATEKIQNYFSEQEKEILLSYDIDSLICYQKCRIPKGIISLIIGKRQNSFVETTSGFYEVKKIVEAGNKIILIGYEIVFKDIRHYTIDENANTYLEYLFLVEKVSTIPEIFDPSDVKGCVMYIQKGINSGFNCDVILKPFQSLLC